LIQAEEESKMVKSLRYYQVYDISLWISSWRRQLTGPPHITQPAIIPSSIQQEEKDDDSTNLDS
jgi:hypothetical protein